MVTGITGKERLLIVRAELLPVLRAALLTAAAGGLALAFSFKAARTAVRNPGTGFVVDTVITAGSRDQSPVGLDFPANGGAVLPNVPGNLGHFKAFWSPAWIASLSS